MTACPRLLLLGLLLAVPASAQALPEPGPARNADPEPGDPSWTRYRAGMESLEAGRLEEARGHLEQALTFHPYSPAVIAGLLRAAGEDADEAQRWALRYYGTAVDDRGRVRLQDREHRRYLPKDGPGRSLAQARAAAAEQVLSFGQRSKGDAKRLGDSVIARWAFDLAVELLRPLPVLESSSREDLHGVLELAEPDQQGVVDALVDLMERSVTEDPDVALRAARILRGLHNQARSSARKGSEPRCDMESAASRASEIIALVRTRMAAESEPLTIGQLRAMDEQERLAFTEEHSDPGNPGRAVSPRGLYVVETTCGHETLLGVAETIEFHHDRLANWYGKDPFTNRQGLVRIVPEQSDMEAEGTPHWWAAGFQAGDLTTFRFAIGRIEGLGRGLTHELTHRFDGTLAPFQQSWLVEGKAVWTGAAYADVRDSEFVEDHILRGRLLTTLYYGYGRRDKLARLLEGNPDDYRHNYVAGYALWVFLKLGPRPEQRLFADRLPDYIRNARGGQRDPVAWFESRFADGEDGRPDGLGEFAEEFSEFCGAFRYRDPEPWITGYRFRVGQRRPESAPWSEFVYDEPTWTWSRQNAEPFFGQGHATRAARLLGEAGEEEASALAWLWALRIDEYTAAEGAALAALLDKLDRPAAAWALRNTLQRRWPEAGLGPPGAPPFASRLGRLTAFLADIDEAVALFANESKPRSSEALARRTDRVAGFLGLMPTGTVHGPDVGVAEHAGLRGWHVDWSAEFDPFRVPNLFYVDEDGDLHVGRPRPRDQTGMLDRRAHSSHTLVRNGWWLAPGHYRLRGRVHFTTTYVSGALVLGYERGDRYLSLDFRWGDYEYSVGVEEYEHPEARDAVRFSFESRWQRDASLGGALFGRSHLLERRAAGFDYEMLVDGSQVHCFVDGELLGTFVTPDGSPIEGHIGFITRSGAIRVQEPTVERLPGDVRTLPGLGVAGTDFEDWERLTNRFADDLPVRPEGVIALWYPERVYVDRWVDVALAAAGDLEQTFAKLSLEQLPVVLLPRDMPADLVERIEAKVPARTEIMRHRYGKGDFTYPFVVLLDGTGAVRVIEEFSYVRRTSMSKQLEHWLRAYAPRSR